MEITLGLPRSTFMACTHMVRAPYYSSLPWHQRRFRPTFQSALSYFVASNNDALRQWLRHKGWTKVRSKNTGVIIDGIYAIAMGNYFFTDREDWRRRLSIPLGTFKMRKEGSAFSYTTRQYPHRPTRAIRLVNQKLRVRFLISEWSPLPAIKQ